MKEIKNLIFDLGGVILDLSVDHTLQAFAEISGKPKTEVFDIFHKTPGFLQYEKGMMSDEAFRDFIRETYAVNADDKQIDTCWNAMLRGIPPGKLTLLNKLRERYQVLLLSNTNEIHLNYINHQMLPAIDAGNSLDVYFHKAYYSHRMLKRKPDAEIFEEVLSLNNMQPDETLFLDDNHGNILGAKAVGIQTVHVVTPDLVLEYFK